jgi:hypothetical protein
MKKHLPTALAALMILMAGTVHGLWTNRWGDNPELQYAVEHLPNLPRVIGDWEGTDVELDGVQKSQVKKAELRVAVMRNYTNRKTGEQIQLMAVCGPPGPISLHTPETCYGAVGRQAAAPVRREYGSDAFWMTDFRRADTAAPTGVKVYWAWRTGKPGSVWEASANPRYEYAASPALYKVYVVRDMDMPERSPVADEVVPQFIEELMPVLDRVVFAPKALTTAS